MEDFMEDFFKIEFNNPKWIVCYFFWTSKKILFLLKYYFQQSIVKFHFYIFIHIHSKHNFSSIFLKSLYTSFPIHYF